MAGINEELQRLFSPSLWSVRLPADVIIKKHVEFIIGESEKCANEIPCRLNIAYGPHSRQKYDLFGTDLSNDAPIFIFIHGGEWQEKALDHNSYRFISRQLYQNKCKSVFLGYNLCPDINLQDIIDQVSDGLKKLIDYALTSGSRGIILAGHSAGAHLVAMFCRRLESLPGKNQKIVKAAFLISGLLDLVPLVKTKINDALKLDEELAEQLSPFQLFVSSPLTLEYFVIVGEHDTPGYIGQSESFCEKLRAGRIQATFKLIDDVDHFNIVERLNETNYELTKLIVAYVSNL